LSSKFFERRSVRNQLKTYLESKGWINLNWSEGFSSLVLETIVPPYITVTLDDLGKVELEIGRDPNINKAFLRKVQIDIYMEDENRVNAITDDISDFLDIEPILIKDNNTTVIGSMVSDTSSIIADTNVPSFEEEESLRWGGVVSCTYDTFYPNG
jgi:hypothetical protein